MVVVLGFVTPAIIFCRFCSKSAKASSFRLVGIAVEAETEAETKLGVLTSVRLRLDL